MKERRFYEICRLDNHVEETAQTIDHAMLRAGELSAVGGPVLVKLFENGKRTVRAMAVNGKVSWAKPCRNCNGATGRYWCSRSCGGLGHEEVR